MNQEGTTMSGYAERLGDLRLVVWVAPNIIYLVFIIIEDDDCLGGFHDLGSNVLLISAILVVVACPPIRRFALVKNIIVFGSRDVLFVEVCHRDGLGHGCLLGPGGPVGFPCGFLYGN